eukprot:2394482-Rhodomonas_salina.1
MPPSPSSPRCALSAPRAARSLACMSRIFLPSVLILLDCAGKVKTFLVRESLDLGKLEGAEASCGGSTAEQAARTGEGRGEEWREVQDARALGHAAAERRRRLLLADKTAHRHAAEPDAHAPACA